MALSCVREVQIGHEEEFFHRNADEISKLAAQGGGGHAVPGGVGRKAEHGTEWCALRYRVVSTHRLNSTVSETFSNVIDYVVVVMGEYCWGVLFC